MEQLTIPLDDRHGREDMIRLAEETIAGLVQDGSQILPARELPPAALGHVHCEMLKDEKGREFRYTSQFDIQSGKILGRIDIRYEPKE